MVKFSEKVWAVFRSQSLWALQKFVWQSSFAFCTPLSRDPPSVVSNSSDVFKEQPAVSLNFCREPSIFNQSIEHTIEPITHILHIIQRREFT